MKIYILFLQVKWTIFNHHKWFELTICNQQGEENQFQITLSPLLDSTYQKTGLITVIRNITKETQARSLKDHFFALLHMNYEHH